jgi:dimethylsulfide dehydrogenase subunit alpha/complex iron-sulfur molybdoenzyme family reductase subunit alpha
MVNRRQFLRTAGLGGCALGLGWPRGAAGQGAVEAPPGQPSLDRAWEDLYRQEFRATLGDAQGYAFHCANCQGNCAFRVSARDGRVVREEQLAEYPQIHPGIPDPNPRGCNKGVIHSQAMYERDRLRYPLKRAGRRGAGRWQRIGWDQALAEIAEQTVDAIATRGPGAVMIHAGTGIVSQGRRAGPLRLGSLLGAIRLYPSSAVGDMFTGATLAYGIPNVGVSLDAWFEMDYIVLWGVNPSVTRMPDAHYLWEARWRGARVVVISPDYNPTAIHADLWVPIAPGTDSFLAMSLVHVVLEEKLYREEFIREQTDLPFLVREGDGRLLRLSDLRRGSRDDVFFCWDEAGGKHAAMPGTRGHFRKTLRLGRLRPALTGRWQVKGHDGRPIPVTTVFERVRAEAARFSPEATQAHTGVHPEVVRILARQYAAARDPGLTIGFSLHKYAWGILSCWAQALFCALTGHGTVDTEHQWSLGGIGALSSPKPARFGSGFLGEWFSGRLGETFLRHYAGSEFARRAGLRPEELVELAEAARARKWFAHHGEPTVRILFADNAFRRNKSAEHYRRAVLRTTKLLVDVNYRMDSTAELADYVLPATSHYEGWDIRGEVGYHRFANVAVPAPGLAPVGEARSEWEICRLLAAHIQAAARRRGIGRIEDPAFTVARGETPVPVTRDLDTLADDFTMQGRLATDRDVVQWLLEHVPAFRSWRLADAEERGFIVLNADAGLTAPLYADRPYRSFEEQFYLRRPYPTLSGRQQFYIDHEVFLRLGCAVPTAREPLHPSRFPLRFYSPHTRWGIHSTWRTSPQMLRLQRGMPHVNLSRADAARRGIRDGARVRVFNDVGAFYAVAKVLPSVRPGTVMMDHAWEPHQFAGRKGMDAPVAGLLSPLELAGGWGHLSFGAEWDGNQLANESSVDVERA